MAKSFYFIRHGETDWNKRQIYQGQNDIPLNEQGREQALNRKSLMIRSGLINEIDALFSSPLQRADKTANIIFNGQSILSSIQYLDEFMECQSEEAARFVLEKKGIVQLPSFDHLPESSETPETLLERVRGGLDIMFKSRAKKPVIVAHGGISVAINLILDLEVVRTPNCCFLEYIYDAETGYSIKCHI